MSFQTTAYSLVGLHDHPWKRNWWGGCRGGGYLLEDAPSFAQMEESAEKRLNIKAIVTNQGHVQYHSLPRVKFTGYSLRPWAHSYELPCKVIRNLLYSDIYCARYSQASAVQLLFAFLLIMFFFAVISCVIVRSLWCGCVSRDFKSI